jgi:hypothetical protein
LSLSPRGSGNDFARLLAALLPPNAGALEAMGEADLARGPHPTPTAHSKGFQTVQRWLDPLGGGRITRRLCEAYPLVPLCEAYALAAFLRSTGLWQPALLLLDGTPPPPSLTSQARMLGRRMQDLRLALVKQHQRMKTEEAGEGPHPHTESSSSSLPPAPGALVRESSVPLNDAAVSNAPIGMGGLFQAISTAASIRGAGTPVEHLNTATSLALDLSSSLDLPALPSSGLATPTPPLPSSLETPTTPPHISTFLQLCLSLVARSKFLLDFTSLPGPPPSAPPSSPSADEQDDPSAPLPPPSPFDLLLCACADFLSDRSLCPPQALRSVFERRLGRAICRRYGLRCYRALLTASSYSSVTLHAVRHIRSALGTRLLQAPTPTTTDADATVTATGAAIAPATPGQAPTTPEATGGAPNTQPAPGTPPTTGPTPPAPASDDANGPSPLIRAHETHHYLTGLEGCPASVTRGVHADFASLYASLLSLLRRSLADKNVTLACHLLSSWALDFDPSDAPFLLRLRILDSLRSILSLRRLGRCVSAGLVINEPHGLHWHPWPLDDVRSGLAHGRITKRIVLEHLRSAPPTILPRAWWAQAGLSPEAGDLDRVVTRLTIGDVIEVRLCSSVLIYLG